MHGHACEIRTAALASFGSHQYGFNSSFSISFHFLQNLVGKIFDFTNKSILLFASVAVASASASLKSS